MKFQISLNEDDFLQHRLYTASKSSSIKMNRLKSWLILSFGALLFSWLFYRSNNRVLTYYFLTAGILILFFYPLYQRYYYKDYYRKSVRKNRRNKFPSTAEFTFTDDFLEYTDKTGEGKIKLREIEEIIETRDYFYLKLATVNGHLIVPKFCLQDIDYLRNEMITLTQKLAVPFISDLNWKWK